MRFLHLADLHIGKTVNGFSMLADQEFVLQQALRIAKENDASAIILAGDIYDKSAPSAEAVALFDWFLNEMSNAGLTCLAVPGNHDSAERIAYAQSILARNSVFFPPVYDGTITKVTLEDQHGPINFWLLPFLKPALVRPFFPEREIGTDYTAALEAALSACDINESERNVLIAHQFVTAAGAHTQRAESELSLGDVDNVNFRVFEKFDYVALGHVHHPQQIGRPQVRYAGSPLKYSLSEVRYPKTAALVDIGEKKGEAVGTCAEVQLVPLPCLHDMRQVKGTFAQLTAKEIVELPGNDDYLHVILTDETPVIDAINRMRTFYPNVMSLEYQSTARAAAQTLETVNVNDIDPLDAFSTFFSSQLGHEISEAQLSIARNALQQALEETPSAPGDISEKGGLR